MNTEVLKKVINNMYSDEELAIKFGNGEIIKLKKNQIKNEKEDNILFIMDKQLNKDILWFKQENKYIDVNSIYYIKVQKNEQKRFEEALEKC